jgi:hypothetical protein
LEAMIAEIEAIWVRVRVIRCDGESATGSHYMLERLGSRGIPLAVAMGKSKVWEVERLIRTLRDGARGAVAEQPYQFDDSLERWLMQSTRWWYTAQPNRKAQDGRTPREKHYGKKLDAKIDARHGFGDYVQVSLKETTNDIHEERTTGALALCPVGNMEGSWYYLSLDTEKVIRSNRVTAVPLDEVVISFFNKRAWRRNKGKAGKKPGKTVKMGTW